MVGNRWFMVTFNEIDETGWESLIFPSTVRYAKYWFERAPTTGRPHAHAVVYFSDSVVFSTAKERLDGDLGPVSDIKRCWNVEKALAYDKHPKHRPELHLAGPFEVGIKPRQGQRTDLALFRDTVWAPELPNAREMVSEFPTIMARYPRFYDTCLATRETGPLPDWHIEFHRGPPRSGKTTAITAVRDQYTGLRVYQWNVDRNGFWNGYTGQEIIWIDDAQNKYIPEHYLFDICNRTIEFVNVKGGSAPYRGRIVLMASTKWFDKFKLQYDDPEDSGLARRFSNDPQFSFVKTVRHDTVFNE